MGGGDPANPNMGAIVLKVAWRDSNALGVNNTNFHMENLLIYSPNYRNSSQQDTCELKPMEMVGMHMGHKTVKQPNWIWATYEHSENALDCTQITPGTHSGSVNTHCPDDPANITSSLNPDNCGEASNEACADCNKPPAMNGIGECVNPFSDPDGKGGWTYLLIPSVVLRNYADRYQWLMATALPMSIHNVQTIQIALPAQLVCNLILLLMIRILPVKQPLLRHPV